MNLVQINERLKDMPEPLVRQYSNGMNPEMVPPYVALGELQISWTGSDSGEIEATDEFDIPVIPTEEGENV
jgi:hypothetical protein